MGLGGFGFCLGFEVGYLVWGWLGFRLGWGLVGVALRSGSISTCDAS